MRAFCPATFVDHPRRQVDARAGRRGIPAAAGRRSLAAARAHVRRARRRAKDACGNRPSRRDWRSRVSSAREAAVARFTFARSRESDDRSDCDAVLDAMARARPDTIAWRAPARSACLAGPSAMSGQWSRRADTAPLNTRGLGADWTGMGRTRGLRRTRPLGRPRQVRMARRRDGDPRGEHESMTARASAWSIARTPHSATADELHAGLRRRGSTFSCIRPCRTVRFRTASSS